MLVATDFCVWQVRKVEPIYLDTGDNIYQSFTQEFSETANIILDETRRVAFVKVYPIKELPDRGEILAFLKS